VNKAIIWRVEKLLPGILTIKKFLRRRLEEQLRMLNEKGAPFEEKKKVLVKLRGYRNRIESLERKCGKGDPPIFGELLLLLILPEENSKYQLGDLAEEYRKREARKGKTVADLNFYGEVMRTAWPRIRSAIWWVFLLLLANVISKMI
jgi:hypothetical protein